MQSPLDLKRLIYRIVQLQNINTQGWIPGDDLEFRNSLPGGSDPRALPDTKWLESQESIPSVKWRMWISTALRLESLISRNHPNNMKRIIHNMVRGKLPFGH